MTVTVYSKSNCVQCDMTKKYLNNNGVEFTEVNLEQDQKALELVFSMGYKAAPVVVTDTDSWSGMKYDKLLKLVEDARG